jgi:hypothetical protein
MDGSIVIKVVHPESNPGRFIDQDGQPPIRVDKDGHFVMISANDWPNYEFVSLILQRGLAPTTAAAVLRKLADKIENYPTLMVMSAGEIHLCDEHGKPEKFRPDEFSTTAVAPSHICYGRGQINETRDEESSS